MCSSLQQLSNNLFAYLRGGQIPGNNIYFSDNGGFSFQLMNTDKLVCGWGKRVQSKEWWWLQEVPTSLVYHAVNTGGKERHLLQCYSHGQWLCE